jgi:hypothetical protein
MGEMRGTYGAYVGKSEGKRPIENLGVHGRII